MNTAHRKFVTRSKFTFSISGNKICTELISPRASPYGTGFHLPSTHRTSIGMAWFYNPTLCRCFENWPVRRAAPPRRSGGNRCPQIRVSPREFASFQILAPQEGAEKHGFQRPASPGQFRPILPAERADLSGLVGCSPGHSWRADSYERRSRTLSLRSFPSTVLPSSLARAALMTAPICFGESAEVSSMASSMARATSASLGAGGR
jgi:hypothetical protein